MKRVTLRRSVDTFGRLWPVGAELFVSQRYCGVANLIDSAGVKRISLCPVDAFEGPDEDGSGTATMSPETLVTAESDDSRSPAETEAVDLYTAGFTTETRRHGEGGSDVDSGASLRSSDGLVAVGAHDRWSNGPPAEWDRVATETGRAASGSTDRVRPARYSPDSAAVSDYETVVFDDRGGEKQPPLRHSSDVGFDPNVEAQLARGTASRVLAAGPGVRWDPESPGECPFEAGQFLVSGDTAGSDPLEASPLEAPTPLPVVNYVRGDHLERHGATRWVLSVEHARRHEWGPEWWLSPAGFPAGERVLFYARRLDRPGPPEGVKPSDGPEWRYFVDLDRGEWSEWGSGEWRPVADGLSLVASGEGVTTEALRHGEEACPTMTMPGATKSIENPTIAATAAMVMDGESSDLTSVATTRLTAPMTVKLSDARVAVDLGTQTGEPSLYPEPHAGMSLDERRGWRRVDGGWRFGPGLAEQMDVWREWLSRLRAYFGEGVAA